MPSSRPVNQLSKRCTKCERDLPLAQFRWVKSRYKLKSGEWRERRYQLRYCIECQRRQWNEKRRRRKAKANAYMRKWRSEHVESVRASTNSYNHSPKGRAARKRWEKSPKGRANLRRYRRRVALRQKADFPAPVLVPYIQKLRKEQGSWAGAAAALRDRVHPDTLRHICDGQRRQVTVEVADILCTVVDASLPELVERSREWAHLTGDPWPVGYHRRQVATAA